MSASASGGGGGGPPVVPKVRLGDEDENERENDENDQPIWSKIASAYMTQLKIRPLITRATTNFFISGIGDFMSQKIEFDTWQSPKRTVIMMTVGGTYIGPALFYWYGFLNRLIPGATLGRAAAKVAVDQLGFVPFFVTGIFTYMGILQGKQPNEIKEHIIGTLPKAIKASWKVWPLATFVNFRFVPPQLQVLYNNCIAVGWNAYFSAIAHRKHHPVSPSK
eukprot:CAMPEP_0184673498 /NCGR_PEP_ID=MMETSP0308-20130426/86704_1 /TAXON_ID=38269 /ORGANISM="Gloeochaete witrockiana, Strain SAG 46.84" /LENGTH=220 /DNA_ID=CAMNT_0027120995 /DNA_START=135 /DNA_END=797 /DNA_ORIENTATION=+